MEEGRKQEGEVSRWGVGVQLDSWNLNCMVGVRSEQGLMVVVQRMVEEGNLDHTAAAGLTEEVVVGLVAAAS